jgi:acetylxylan esterase
MESIMNRLLTRSMLLGSLVWFGACIGADPDVDPTSQAATTCAAVHIITTRASTEAPGEGITGALVDQIISSSTQTITRAAVDYPATLNNYNSSSLQGITALTNLLTTQVQDCPTQKIVLLGYSQGAHVTLDVLGGGQGGSLGTATPPISSTIGSHVTAVATFGDPRHVINQPYDLGTSTRNGIFPRSSAQLQVLLGYAPNIETFCDRFDTFCDSGFSNTVHTTYLDRYQDTAAQFVLGKIGG